jgi:hypothetical protein
MDLKKNQKKCEITLEEKIKILKKNGYDITSIVEKIIEEAYNSVIQMKKNNSGKKNNEITKIMKKIKKDDSDSDSDCDTSDDEHEEKKYVNVDQEQVILKLLNHILKNIKRPEIKNIREFKKINRIDILKINYDIFNDMEDEIIKNFDKIKIGWYRRKIIANYVLSFIKSACLHLKDTKFTYTRTHEKNIMVTLYSIS